MIGINMNDIRSLDLNLLKALDALLDERNVTRAAARLALTQPAVSNMLNKLRTKFNDPLFVRAQHGLIPTDRALALEKPVKRILCSINDLLQPIDFDPKKLQTTFKIAANDHDMQTIGLPFVLTLKKQSPLVKVSFLSFHQLDIQTMLERGDLDLILIDPVNSPESLHSRILYNEHYVCIMRKGHPAIKNDAITLDKFCEYEHVLVSYMGGMFEGVTDEALAKVGRTRNVSLSVTSFLLLPSILKHSDFIAVVPKRLTCHMKDLAIMEPPVNVSGYTKIMAWHDRTHNNPIQQWLRNLIYLQFNGEKTE